MKKPIPKGKKGKGIKALKKKAPEVAKRMGYKKGKKVCGKTWTLREHSRKRKRIKAGSKEKMRKVGSKGAPTKKQFKQAAKTAKKK
jgi:hypothetical protein